MAASSETNELAVNGVGDLKKTLVFVWTISSKLPSRARSDVFSTDVFSKDIDTLKVGLNALLLMNESYLPENVIKFNLWFYTRAIVKHTCELSLSLLDDQNRQCYVVEKNLRNSTSETTKVCATVDFSIIPHHPQKFFHNGTLRVQCAIRVNKLESVSSSLKTSTVDTNKLEAQFLKHLDNILKDGVLTEKCVSILTIRKDEVKSNTLAYSSSKFFISLKKSKEHSEICLNVERRLHSSQQKMRVTLAVLDDRGIAHCTKESVIEDSSKIFLDLRKPLMEKLSTAFKGELRIYCSLQIDTLSEVPEVSKSAKPATSRSTTICPVENAADVNIYSSDPPRGKESTSSPVTKLFSKSAGISTQKLVAEKSVFASFKAGDKSQVEKAMKEMLQLLDEAQVNTVVIVCRKH